MAWGQAIPAPQYSSSPASAGLFFEGRPVLLLDQADVAAVSRQVHLALFYDAQLDIGAMD